MSNTNRHERDMLHFRINKNGNKFLIGDTSFNDISSLVIHFKSFPIHNEQGYLDVYLKHPICRLHGISSWKDSSLECCSPRVPSDVYLTLTLFNHPGKPSTPELDWVKIPNSPDLGRKNELPYVNDKCGKGPARPCACDWSDQNNLRMSLKNGWVLEPLLVFKSPNGNIHENFPRDVWLSLSQEEREDIEKLSDKFNYLDISKKKVGSSRGHPY